MKHSLSAVIAIAAVALIGPAGAQDKPEMPKVRLAVGGKSAIFYLPLSITERLGYFRDAGLEVEIADVQSGARALQSLVGGSAEVALAPSIIPSRCSPKASRSSRSRNTGAIPDSCSP